MKLLIVALFAFLAIDTFAAASATQDAENALNALRARKLDEAVQRMQDFVSVHPDHPYAGVIALRLIEAYIRTGRLSLARISLDHLRTEWVLPTYRDEVESATAVLAYLTTPSPVTLDALSTIVKKYPDSAMAVLGESFIFRFPTP